MAAARVERDEAIRKAIDQYHETVVIPMINSKIDEAMKTCTKL
jgi:hypothetical protein